jgi:Transketolase, thiamine diphosphate binding domain
MTIPIDKSPSIKAPKHPLDELCINTIRTLAIDAVQAANSGHPGTPMAMAPVGYYLWQYLLRFDPEDPIWPNRDRFVLSAGHASMLLYALLHLTGVRAVSKDYERLGEPSFPSRRSRRFGSGIAAVLDTLSTAGPRASRQRPARSGRDWPIAWAWRWRAAGWRRTLTAPAIRT